MYKATNQKDKMDQLYRLLASSETYSHHHADAYYYVADDYISKGDYKNAIIYYKKTGYVTKLKELAKNNQGITPAEYFDYVKYNNNSTELAKCYLEGFGTAKDEKAGFTLLKNQYDNMIKWNQYGTHLSAYHIVPLAECYYFGRGTTYNLKEALKLFLQAEKCVGIEHFDILYAICWCYYYTQDYTNAYKRLLAYTKRDGIVAKWAYYLLGNCYYYGQGTTQNYKLAFDNYVIGFNKKHSDSCWMLGCCYLNGQGVLKDYKKAIEYFTLGYESYKNSSCAYCLGYCYELGYGYTKDIVKAYQWYEISAKLNHSGAKKKLDELKPSVQNAKKQSDDLKKCEELTKEIIERITELKQGNTKTTVIKEAVVEGSAKEALNELVGLESVKKEIQELENFIRVMNIRKQRGLPVTDISKHMVFTGNPGTGKTTVARIVAQIYKENGILKTGQLVETDRDGLVGQYIGETGKKTRKVIESAMGGVLFIDEAYSLIPKDSSKDFGPEAIATLLKMMEDYKNDFVVIVAGYKDEMQFFIDSNPGLKSRFTSYVHFEDYTPEQMQEIFTLKANKDMFKITDEAKEALISLWNESHHYKNLGNGRCVRNVYEKVQRLQSNRIIEQNLTSDEDFITILKEDIPSPNDIFR